MQSMGFSFGVSVSMGTETKALERQYRECVTVRDGCDGIFDSGAVSK